MLVLVVVLVPVPAPVLEVGLVPVLEVGLLLVMLVVASGLQLGLRMRRSSCWSTRPVWRMYHAV